MADVVLGRWELGAEIGAGRGGFGKVFSATDGKEVVAIKFVPKSPGADREVLFADLPQNATNIVPVLDTEEFADSWALVMPLATESLEDFIDRSGGPVDQAQALEILLDVAVALESIARQVVHRDLKPGNVLLLNGRWCLADFGIARYANASTDTETRKFSWTRQYAAPEQWQYGHATPATDVYAFGVLAYELLEGHLPFPGPRIEDFRTQHCTVAPPAMRNASPQLASLMQHCLIKAPEARPSASDVRQQLERIRATPTLGGARASLARAQLEHVERQSSAAITEQIGLSANQRRVQLRQVAGDILWEHFESLLQVVQEEAPGARISKGAQALAVLNDGRLEISQISGSPPNPWGVYTNDWVRNLDVVAYASITARGRRLLDGWCGRAHSLWYCNYGNREQYDWYEIPFFSWENARNVQVDIEPFALIPGERAARALNQSLSNPDAVPAHDSPIRLTGASWAEFQERWLNWFAQAATGILQYPSRIPYMS